MPFQGPSERTEMGEESSSALIYWLLITALILCNKLQRCTTLPMCSDVMTKCFC